MDFRTWIENQNNIQSFLSDSVIKTPVYHGTDKAKFNQFQVQKSTRAVLFALFDVETQAFFFSENPHDAMMYGSNIARCYVKLRNPLLDPRRDRHLAVDRLPPEKEKHLVKILRPLIEKDENGAFMDIGVRRHYLNPQKYEFPQQWIYEAVNNYGLDWDCLDNPQVVQNMKALGYDGTFVADPETYLGRSLCVFSSDQVMIDTWTPTHGDNPDPAWGEKDDWYTKKVDGYDTLIKPDPNS